MKENHAGDSALTSVVTGEVIPDPTPTATAEPAQTAEPGQTGGLGNGGGDDGDAGGGELGMTIVIGLALGGLAGFGVRRLRTAA